MPSVQAFSVALLVGTSAFATPILGSKDTVKSLVGGKSISDMLRNNHGQNNNWKKHPAFNSVCSSLENPKVLLDNVKRGDWTSCSEQSLREDWKQLLESCCESREHEGESKGEHGDEHDNKPWDDGKKYECKSIEESRRFLESIKKNDYSECPKELEHDEWKKHVEACCEEEKEWKGEDDEWKGENDDDDEKEWDGEGKEWDGKDGELDGKDDEWKGGKDDEHHGKKCTTIEESRRLHELIKKEDYSECPKEFEHEEWKKFIEECCEEVWGKDDEHHSKLPHVPEHTCIPSKHLPKDYSGMTVETWLSTLNYERDIIHERSQFNSVMLD